MCGPVASARRRGSAQLPQLCDQRLGRRRIAHLCARDEIGEDVAAFRPGPGLVRDRVQFVRGHAGRLVLAAGHQPGIGKVGGRLVDPGPFGRLVVDGIDDGRAVFRGQIVELLACRTSGCGPPARGADAGRPSPCGNSFRKPSKSSGSNFLVAMNCQLIGPSLSPSSGQPLVQEPVEALLALGQHLAIGAVAAGLDREDEPVGRLVAPLHPAVGLEGRIVGAVDLDRGQRPAGELQLALLGQIRRDRRRRATAHRSSRRCLRKSDRSCPASCPGTD